jgi:hypothetical protein
LSEITNDAFAGTEMLYTIGYALPLANVGLSDTDIVIDAAFAVRLDATTVLTLFTELAEGVKPVNAVVPSYVQFVLDVAAAAGFK